MSQRQLGMGGHESPSSKSEVWLTPPEILLALGRFDLDPCAAPEPRPWATAETMWTREHGGLRQGWFGRVWMNPPYGSPAVMTPWLARLAEHGRGTALLFARTETDLFHRFVWEAASAILFLRGRLHFHRQDGRRAAHNAGAPSCLVAYGEDDAACLAVCGVPGRLVPLRAPP